MMASKNPSTREPQCGCPFCGSGRKHDPPTCHCTVCDDQGKPVHHITAIKVADIPPPHKDVADLLTSEGGDAKYEEMIANARPGPSWMIAHLDDVGHHQLETVEGQVAASHDMVDILLRQHPVARERYAAELAEKLGCSVGAIKETLDEALGLRRAYYERHPTERPWRRSDPDGEIGMDIPV